MTIYNRYFFEYFFYAGTTGTAMSEAEYQHLNLIGQSGIIVSSAPYIVIIQTHHIK